MSSNMEVAAGQLARCNKCRVDVTVKDGRVVLMRNGTLRRVAGRCPTCGGNVSRILGKA